MLPQAAPSLGRKRPRRAYATTSAAHARYVPHSGDIQGQRTFFEGMARFEIALRRICHKVNRLAPASGSLKRKEAARVAAAASSLGRKRPRRAWRQQALPHRNNLQVQRTKVKPPCLALRLGCGPRLHCAGRICVAKGAGQWRPAVRLGMEAA